MLFQERLIYRVEKQTLNEFSVDRVHLLLLSTNLKSTILSLLAVGPFVI